MTKLHEEVFEFVKAIMLGFLDVEDDAITPESTFEELAVESLDFVEVQVELERVHGVKISSAVFASGDVRTVGDFIRYVVEEKLATAVEEAS